jgi:hypothetical protein
MSLTVKEGREYVLGGKVYRSGETVEDVPEKFTRILTGPKGPLELGPDKNRTDPPVTARIETSDDLATLRDEYHALLGKRPFNGWDEAELRTRMAEYRRTDMRAAPAGEYRTTAMEAEE